MDSNPTNQELGKSVVFLSEEYDDMKNGNHSVEEDLKRFESKLDMISKKVDVIDEAIESIMKYSYQYSVKIVGLPQTSTETAEETVDICVKLFKEMGANIS